jgi:pimeloyl-ACP methyl ester carboxylesterase
MFIAVFFRRFIKVFTIIVLLLCALFYGLFYFYTSPKSDKDILSEFEDVKLTPKITYHNFKNLKYRKLTIVNDTTLPTIVFVHGTIGSCVDFINYMKDSMIYSKANFVSYDRVGYNYEDTNDVQESIAFERDMLQSITKDLPKNKTVVVGYSYGGPIVLADTTRYKKAVLLAPAVFSSKEVMPWLVNVYKWKATRWMVPPIWKQAAKEKLSHRNDLKIFEKKWNQNENEIVAIHGENDQLVPFENSVKLAAQFPKGQFDLVQIRRGDHGVLWNKFEFIREQLILCLN